MEPTTKGSSAARMAIIYITIGALTLVWTTIWWLYMHNHPPASDGPWYACYGFQATGLAFLLIGLVMGRVGRSAREADLPPAISSNPTPQTVQNPATGAAAIMPLPQQAAPMMAPPMMPGGGAVPQQPR